VSPTDGALQALALLVAWGHGCLGLFFWLRLKPWFPRAAPLLLTAAVLVPTAALFGFLGGGRAVMALAADENWRIENVPVGATTPAGAAQVARLGEVRSLILASFLGLVGAALAGRVVRRLGELRRGLVRLTYPDGRIVSVPAGTSVLEASRRFGIRHASVCGGRGRCSTCRVRVAGALRLAAAGPDEQAVLDRVGAGPEVRLACQLKPACDLQVFPLVAVQAALSAARRDGGASGEERFVVAVFVDMRGSTRLAEQRLPFDTVFLINRFLDAVVRAVVASGGSPNQFLGDGLLALFGLATDGRTATRQALRAVAGIGAEIAALNTLMAADLPEPIRFGVGVHAGTAILGEIGSREGGHAVFTAIGDPVNVAARLQAMTKRWGCEALVSDIVFEEAGIEPDLPRHETAIEGRDGQLWMRPLATVGLAWREAARQDT